MSQRRHGVPSRSVTRDRSRPAAEPARRPALQQQAEAGGGRAGPLTFAGCLPTRSARRARAAAAVNTDRRGRRPTGSCSLQRPHGDQLPAAAAGTRGQLLPSAESLERALSTGVRKYMCPNICSSVRAVRWRGTHTATWGQPGCSRALSRERNSEGRTVAGTARGVTQRGIDMEDGENKRPLEHRVHFGR